MERVDQRQFAKALRQNMTDAEQLLWRHLRAHRLDGQTFRRQQPIGTYIVDFVHFGARLIVEADGGQHNGSESDPARDAWLREQGFKVMRFWNNDILQNTEAVLSSVLDALESPAPSPPTPLPRGERGVNPGPSPARGEGSEQIYL
ncbi:MAG TPA: endonuclease domain-containing protein [Lamprocystis sp. (in: g-proteobacteria)]|nr:endonuclease domain-containing protein [Lamprocystis sp. (in: g-proteobacteria)]